MFFKIHNALFSLHRNLHSHGSNEKWCGETPKSVFLRINIVLFLRHRTKYVLFDKKVKQFSYSERAEKVNDKKKTCF